MFFGKPASVEKWITDAAENGTSESERSNHLREQLLPHILLPAGEHFLTAFLRGGRSSPA
jgi:hypothetical protein